VTLLVMDFPRRAESSIESGSLMSCTQRDRHEVAQEPVRGSLRFDRQIPG
jgi:hypothetical protein